MAESSIGSYKGIVERSGVLDMPVDSVQKGVLFVESQLVWRIPMFRLAFYTGLRAPEIGRLKWRHVRLEREEMEITKQKNKNDDILLSDEALSILHEIDHRRGYVFVSPQQDSTKDRSVNSFRETNSRAFTRYRKAAGIERPLTLHGLQHGFCSQLVEKGHRPTPSSAPKRGSNTTSVPPCRRSSPAVRATHQQKRLTPIGVESGWTTLWSRNKTPLQ